MVVICPTSTCKILDSEITFNLVAKLVQADGQFRVTEQYHGNYC